VHVVGLIIKKIVIFKVFRKRFFSWFGSCARMLLTASLGNFIWLIAESFILKKWLPFLR